MISKCAERVNGQTKDDAAAMIPNTLAGVLSWLGLPSLPTSGGGGILPVTPLTRASGGVDPGLRRTGSGRARPGSTRTRPGSTRKARVDGGQDRRGATSAAQ